MNQMKKWFSVLLCIMLLTCQAAGAFAQEAVDAPPTVSDALAAGREVAYSVDFTWHPLPLQLFDEETETVLSSLFDAITVEGRVAMPSDDIASYSDFALKMSGTDAITFSSVATDDTLYLNSPLLGQSIAIPAEDVEALFTNLGSYLDQASAELAADSLDDEGTAVATPPSSHEYRDMFAQLYASMTDSTLEVFEPAPMTDEEIAESLYASFEMVGLGSALEAATQWVQENLQGEPYAGGVDSVFDVQTDEAVLFSLTKDQLVDYMTVIWDEMVQSEVFWTTMLEMINAQMPPEEQMDIAEFMAVLPQARDELVATLQTMPDDTIMQYAMFVDATGNPVLNLIEVIVPADESGYGEFSLYCEWLPEGMPVYAEAFFDQDGVTFLVEPKEALPDGTIDSGFTATMGIYSLGEETGIITVDASSIASIGDDQSIWDGAILISYADETQAMGVQAVINKIENYSAEDITKEATIDLYLLMGMEPLPVLSAHVLVASQDPQGIPFPIEGEDDIAFTFPGQMSEEEFATYAGEEVPANVARTTMYVMSLLPTEIYTLMMEDMNY